MCTSSWTICQYNMIGVAVHMPGACYIFNLNFIWSGQNTDHIITLKCDFEVTIIKLTC
jgi:hypothetical protein